MPWLNLFNRVFSEPKPKKKKKQKDWVPDPKYFENELKRKIDTKARVNIRLKNEPKIRQLRKEKYVRFSGENLEQKLQREKVADHFISELTNEVPIIPNHLDELDKVIGRSVKRSEKKNNLKSAIERLIRMKYVYRNPQDLEEVKIREKQVESLRPWINYFKGLPNFDVKFAYLVLGTILKYDLYWMEKNDDGTFRTGERSKGTKKEFPIFDPDSSPVVIAHLKDCVNFLLELDNDQGMFTRIMDTTLQNLYGDADGLKSAYRAGDIREMYFILKEHVETSQIKESQIEEIVKEEWLPVFSFRSCNTEEEKYEVAKQLAKATKYSRGFCIKSIMTAYGFLSEGDIYLYNSIKKIKRKDGKLQDLGISEIAIHVKSDGNINPNEIHGNGPNQGINKAYLPVAREWVAKSELANKDEFEVKFVDAEMMAQVEEKIKKMQELPDKGIKIIQGGEYDLTSRELKFLYQIYRPITSFELDSEMAIRHKVENLLKIRFDALAPRTIMPKDLKDYRKEQEKIDYAKMFGNDCFRPVQIQGELYDFFRKSIFEIIKRGGTKVFAGDLNVKFSDFSTFGDLEVIEGDLVLSLVGGKGFPKGMTALGRLKKIKGIVLTEEDKKIILSGKVYRFPLDNDPRLARVYLEN